MIKEIEPTSQSTYYIIDGYGNFGKKRKDVLRDQCIATISRNPERNADYNSIDSIPQSIVDKTTSVVVTIPDPDKLRSVEQWLRLRKNVMVEKPFLVNQYQLDNLKKISAENNVIWFTAYNHRNESNIIKIKELLDQGFLGKIYHAKLCYGFGNSQQVIGTWRDHGYGALADVGSHLIDLTHYFFGYEGCDFESVNLRKVELTSGIDFAQFRTYDKVVLCEASMIHWKNTFEIDIYGEKGSLHQRGLSKWGETSLSIRQRQYPSGPPKEEFIIRTNTTDDTLTKDFAIFESLCQTKQTSYNDDLRVITALQKIYSL